MEWNNKSCMGYCILAMRNAGCSKEEISAVLTEMHYIFDEVSIKQAEDFFMGYD